MQVNTYLNFSGQCKEAFEYYAKVLGGEIVMMMTHRDAPTSVQTPSDMLDTVMHARIQIGSNVIMGSDAPPQYFTQPAGFSVSIMLDDAAEGKRIFDALADGGTVQMPFEKTFWAEGFGALVDRFGTPWMVNAGLA